MYKVWLFFWTLRCELHSICWYLEYKIRPTPELAFRIEMLDIMNKYQWKELWAPEDMVPEIDRMFMEEIKTTGITE